MCREIEIVAILFVGKLLLRNGLSGNYYTVSCVAALSVSSWHSTSRKLPPRCSVQEHDDGLWPQTWQKNISIDDDNNIKDNIDNNDIIDNIDDNDNKINDDINVVDSTMTLTMMT